MFLFIFYLEKISKILCLLKAEKPWDPTKLCYFISLIFFYIKETIILFILSFKIKDIYRIS